MVYQVLEFKKKKQTFIKVGEDDVDFFLYSNTMNLWLVLHIFYFDKGYNTKSWKELRTPT